MRPTVTRGPVVSYTAVSPLPVEDGRSVLCCAISQVTLGGRYPPSCSMEPGSSSADPNEDHGRGHQEVSCRLQSELGRYFWDLPTLAGSLPFVYAIVARV